MIVVEIIFWVAVGLLLYTYFGYPFLLLAAASVIQILRDLRFLFRRDSRRTEPVTDAALPAVSLVIPAYNEEAVIAAKLDNCLALDYPKDRIEILVGSDGSDDRTNEIVRSYADRGVVLAAYYERRGKPSVINDTVARSEGDVVVLTDATTMIEPDALRKIVRHFDDREIGGVNGELRFVSPEDSHRGEGWYWKYEVMIKFMENRFGVVLGSSGALCAVRKAVFRPIPANCICDDLLITLNVMLDGYRAVYDPEARSTEETAASVEMESSRRERIGAGNLQTLGWTLPLLDPRRGWVAPCYLSHKILKWLTWALMLVAFLANVLLLGELLYIVLFFLQLTFYATAALDALDVRLPVLSAVGHVTRYFVAMHLGLCRGFFRYIFRTQDVAWEREHR
jgi:cellulose synthase/poly-beta-1,6-N-acetylglucosamine synthase-like glycosyltransferase